MMKEKNNSAVGKVKKSLMRSQVRAIAILLAAVLLLGAITAVVLYIVRKDIDTYREVLTYGETDTYASYFSRRDGDGFAVFDEEGKALPPFEYEKKVCYETRSGTILTLDENGMFSVIAMLDNGDGESINNSNTALLLYQRLESSEIKSIKSFNDKGGHTVYSVSEDLNGDGKNENNFYIKGYENSPINKIVLSALTTRCGILSLQVKLDRETMLAEDEKHKNDEGYTPIINADGSVNFDIYGLGDKRTVTGDDGKPEVRDAQYFILSDIYGNIHKVVIGDLSSDGAYYYVRYENIASALIDSATASAAEKQREREKLERIEKNVYLLARDPSASSGYSSDMSTTVLASAAEISSPTIILAYSTSNYYDVRNFTVQRREGEELKKVICFTYDPLDARLGTIRQDLVYHIVDAEALGLSGYEMDTDRTFDALFALTDISAASTDTSSSTMTPGNTSVNYVKTVALISEKVNDLSSITEEMMENDEEVRSSLLALSKYGLLDAEYMLSFDTPLDINDTDSDIVNQAVVISKKTENDTYYVWSPMFSQVVEIGAQYLSFLEYDSFDWVDRDLFHTGITFSDGLSVTAGDFSVIFNLYQKLTVSTRLSISAGSQSYYSIDITTDENGARRLDVTSNVVYNMQYTDGSTAQQTLSSNLLSLSISTVRNYCRRLLGEELTGLTAEELSAIERYAQNVGGKNVANGIATVTHTVTVSGDDYGYVPNKTYLLTFTYSGGELVLTAKAAGSASSRTLYDSAVFDDYYSYYLDDQNKETALTEEEMAAVKEFFLTVQRVKSEETRVTARVNGGEPIEIEVDTFKDLYMELLKISFYGRADETDTAGGKALSAGEMAALAASDNCSLKIEFYRCVGEDLVYRSYDYSATKSFTTINRSGCFYINKMTKDAFLRSVKTVAEGGSLS